MSLPDRLKSRSDGSDDADKCPSPPSSSSSHGQGLVTPLVVTASVLVFLSLVSLSVYCLVCRRRRRRQQSLLPAEAANPAGAQGLAAPDDVEGGGPEEEGGGGDDVEVVHHAWHIRTVGLDEAAIESIALTRYRAGAGVLGAADCSVCLGEFRDGELLRLLPKCGHAFHVPCIGTWLRSHVNCPLCRADVILDPAAAAAGDTDPPTVANAVTDAEQASSNTEILDHEQPSPGQQQNEQQELRVQIDQPDQSSSPEPRGRPPGSRVQNFRRVASMDSSIVIVSAGEAPEDEQSSKENQGNGDAACCRVSSGSGRLYHMKRSLSGSGRRSLVSRSRHCRTRSSMLPS